MERNSRASVRQQPVRWETAGRGFSLNVLLKTQRPSPVQNLILARCLFGASPLTAKPEVLHSRLVQAQTHSGTQFYIQVNQTSRISGSSLFRDIMQRRFVPGYQRFWTTYGPHLQGTSSRNSYTSFGYKTRAKDGLILWSCGDNTNLVSW